MSGELLNTKLSDGSYPEGDLAVDVAQILEKICLM